MSIQEKSWRIQKRQSTQLWHPQPNETPIDIEKTIKALERNKFVVHYFETGAEAVAYLKNRIQNKCVAIGDSRTL